MRPVQEWVTCNQRLANANTEGKMAVMQPVDRQRGTIIGLSVAATLGAAVEFEPPGIPGDDRRPNAGNTIMPSCPCWTCQVVLIGSIVASWFLASGAEEYLHARAGLPNCPYKVKPGN